MRIILTVFGAMGIAISCVQGIEPFIEVTQWIAWFTGHWVDLTRAFWAFIVSALGLSIPVAVADALTALAYIVSLIIGTRRLGSDPESFSFGFLERMESIDDTIEGYLEKINGNRFPLNYIFAMTANVPIILVYFLIFQNSRTQGLIFLGTLVIIYLPLMLIQNKDRANKVGAFIFGGPPEGSDMEGRHMFLLTIIVMPLIILALVALVLVINEIALNADNIRSAYDWARCDAGIACKE